MAAAHALAKADYNWICKMLNRNEAGKKEAQIDIKS